MGKWENGPCPLLSAARSELAGQCKRAHPGDEDGISGGLTTPATTQAQNQCYMFVHPISDLLEHGGGGEG